MAKANWTVSEKGYWSPLEKHDKTSVKLAPGLYEMEHRETMFGEGTSLKSLEPTTDNLIPLEGSLAEYIAGSVREFWGSVDRYKTMGLIHKRGILMEGEPGTGKTAICMLAARQIAADGGCGIFVAPKTRLGLFPEMLARIREIHPTLPLLVILEDIDVHARDLYILLALLDGEKQVSNVVFLGTTNYIEKLDARITNRPSRFDEVIRVKPPVSRARQAYFRAIMPPDTEDSAIHELVRVSRGLNFAHLKELAISAYVYKKSPEAVATRLRALGLNKGTGFTEAED